MKVLVAGNVASDGLDSLREIRDAGLDGQEIEFVRQVYMDNSYAKKLGLLAKELDLVLSVHASYYINLVSDKAPASRKRILAACERAHHMGAKNVVFHAGYYGKNTPEQTYGIIKKQIITMQKEIPDDVVLCPETTGKKSQFGSVQELLQLRKETGCGICVDFGHVLARNGTIDYSNLSDILPDDFHAHFSGIEYTEKGERRHIPISENEFRKLASVFGDNDITIVCEAPDPFGDALKMKRILNEKDYT